MSEYLIKSETLQDIANALREKTGETGTFKVQDFATEIREIQAGGGGGTIIHGSISPTEASKTLTISGIPSEPRMIYIRASEEQTNMIAHVNCNPAYEYPVQEVYNGVIGLAYGGSSRYYTDYLKPAFGGGTLTLTASNYNFKAGKYDYVLAL